MVNAGAAVRGGRAFIENEGWPALGLGEGLLEYILAAPELEDLPLDIRAVVTWRHWREHDLVSD
jgi:hypothetical protein